MLPSEQQRGDQASDEQQAGLQQRGGGVEGAVGALVGAAHLEIIYYTKKTRGHAILYMCTYLDLEISWNLLLEVRDT